MLTRGGIVLTLAFLLVLPLNAAAAEYGQGFGVGGTLLPDGLNTLVAKMRLGDALGIEAEVSLSTFSDDGNSRASFKIGLGMLVHTRTDAQLQPFWGGRFAIDHESVDVGQIDESDTSFGFAGVIGAEYFVAKKLSLEGEVGLGMHFGSFSLGTQTRLAALLYF
jgi:opacity protein-like surface antigen